jgi:hypothetical protein
MEDFMPANSFFRKLPLIGLVLVCLAAAYAAVYAASEYQETQQTLPAAVGDLNAVSAIEVRTESGTAVLSGTFGTAKVSGGETERNATLAAAAGQSGKGTAEIEINRNGDRLERELEIDVEGLSPNANYVIFVDGQQVSSFTTNDKGAAEVEMKG